VISFSPRVNLGVKQYSSNFKIVIKSQNVTIKSTEQHFPVVLFVYRYFQTPILIFVVDFQFERASASGLRKVRVRNIYGEPNVCGKKQQQQQQTNTLFFPSLKAIVE